MKLASEKMSAVLLPGLLEMLERLPEMLSRRQFLSWERLLQWLCMAVVAAIFTAHVAATVKSTHLNNFSNPEEWAYTNISASNYLKYGFRNSFFLQDHSTSPDPGDHPYVYNHMPPGPDIATAIVRSATGGDYRWTRFIFALMLLPGVYYLVRFTALVLARIDARGAPFVILLAGPYFFIGQAEAQIHSIYLFLAFAPLVWGIEGERSGSRTAIAATWLALFFLAVYVQYVLVAGVVFAWILIYVLRIFPVGPRLLLIALSAIAAGVLAHLLQNLAFLGAENFVKELAYTVGNRTIGNPTQEEVAAFYESLGLVHHGARPPQASTLIPTIIDNLRFRYLPTVAIYVALLAFAARIEKGRTSQAPAVASATFEGISAGELYFVLRLFLWAAGTSLGVIFLFPAFTQEVNLRGYGMNNLLFAIPTLAVLAIGWRYAWRFFGRLATRLTWLAVLFLLPLGVLVLYETARAQGTPAAVLTVLVVMCAALPLKIVVPSPEGVGSVEAGAQSAEISSEGAVFALLVLLGWGSIRLQTLGFPFLMVADVFVVVSAILAAIVIDRAAMRGPSRMLAGSRETVIGGGTLLLLLLLPWIAVRPSLVPSASYGMLDVAAAVLCLSAAVIVAIAALAPERAIGFMDIARSRIAGIASERLRIFKIGRAIHVALVAWGIVYSIVLATQFLRFSGIPSLHSLLQCAVSATAIVLFAVQTRQPYWLHYVLRGLAERPGAYVVAIGLAAATLFLLPVAGLFMVSKGPGRIDLFLLFVYVAFLSWVGLVSAMSPALLTRELGAALLRVRMVLEVGTVPRNVRPALYAAIGFACLIIAMQAARNTAQELRAVWRSATQESAYKGVEELKRFHSRLFMTNINVPVPAFFTDSPGFGVCELNAVSENGEINSNGCKISFMKRKQYWRAQQPEYFFFSSKPSLFPGFADCLPNGYFAFQRGEPDCVGKLQRRLADHYALAHKNDLFEVYELTKRLR